MIDITKLSLPEALQQLGCEVKRDQEYRSIKDSRSVRYHIKNHEKGRFLEVLITGEKWYNTRAERGNGGLVSLVMHVWSENYTAAMSRINGKPIINENLRRQVVNEVFYIDSIDKNQLPLKLDLISMELPLFVLTKNTKSLVTVVDTGIGITLEAKETGLATMADKDIWVFIISHLVNARNRGDELSKVVEFRIIDFLKTTGKTDGGDNYKLVKKSMERLAATRFTTNLNKEPFKEQGKWYRLLEKVSYLKDKFTETVSVQCVLPDWLMWLLTQKDPQVLTLSKEYFQIKNPTLKRLYELVRKHCGYQMHWDISVYQLHKKCGSRDALRNFKLNIIKILQQKDFPDYLMLYVKKTDRAFFTAKDREKLKNSTKN